MPWNARYSAATLNRSWNQRSFTHFIDIRLIWLIVLAGLLQFMLHPLVRKICLWAEIGRKKLPCQSRSLAILVHFSVAYEYLKDCFCCKMYSKSCRKFVGIYHLSVIAFRFTGCRKLLEFLVWNYNGNFEANKICNVFVYTNGSYWWYQYWNVSDRKWVQVLLITSSLIHNDCL